MPGQREEQADIPIHIMPDGDTAGSRGAAIEALKLARVGGLIIGSGLRAQGSSKIIEISMLLPEP